MRLNEIRDNPGSHHRSKRVGRGLGSGKGKTCGSGGKGQTARSGVSLNGFEGGQTPLFRRLPKRGFRVAVCVWSEVTLSKLQRAFDKGLFSSGQTLSDSDFHQNRLIPRGKKVRILASGDLMQPVILNVSHVSRGAAEKVKVAGGKVIGKSDLGGA